MSALRKLMKARIELQGRKLTKSGHNKFAGYTYFELGDFLPVIQEIFHGLDLAGVVSYGTDVATLTITDVDDGDSVVITSPMSSAALKGCHEVQNLGAVETYLRRYLWVTAMEIVEHDALDATTGKETKTKPILPTEGAMEALTADQQIAAKDEADFIVQRWEEGDKAGAFDAYMTLLEGDNMYAVAVWKMLAPYSKIRSELKRMKAEAK